jgi:hypothetical protein
MLSPDGSAVVYFNGNKLSARTFLDRREFKECSMSPLASIGSGKSAWFLKNLRLSPDGYLASTDGGTVCFGKVDEGAEMLSWFFQLPVLTPAGSTALLWPSAVGLTITWHGAGQVGWLKLDTSGKLIEEGQQAGSDLPVVAGSRLGWQVSGGVVVREGTSEHFFKTPAFGQLLLGKTHVFFLPAAGEAIWDLEQNCSWSRGLPAVGLEVREAFAGLAQRVTEACREVGVGCWLSELGIKDGRYSVHWNISGPESGVLAWLAGSMAHPMIEVEGLTRIGAWRSSSYGSMGGVSCPSIEITPDIIQELLVWLAKHRLQPASLARTLQEIRSSRSYGPSLSKEALPRLRKGLVEMTAHGLGPKSLQMKSRSGGPIPLSAKKSPQSPGNAWSRTAGCLATMIC